MKNQGLNKAVKATIAYASIIVTTFVVAACAGGLQPLKVAKTNVSAATFGSLNPQIGGVQRTEIPNPNASTNSISIFSILFTVAVGGTQTQLIPTVPGAGDGNAENTLGPLRFSIDVHCIDIRCSSFGAILGVDNAGAQVQNSFIYSDSNGQTPIYQQLATSYNSAAEMVNAYYSTHNLPIPTN